MTPQEFVAKWKKADLSERSACQQHFLDLCDVLRQPKPADVDPTGEFYTFEKGVEKTDGGKGFRRRLEEGQIRLGIQGQAQRPESRLPAALKYREALENPPLLIVCDLDRFEMHTNFTGTVNKYSRSDLDGTGGRGQPQMLHNVFTNPDRLKPGDTQAAVTEEVAERFAKLAEGIRTRGIAPQKPPIS